MESESEEASAPLYVWIGLIIISALSFWCQATVTEERFVPALNVIATEFGIPDDVAGATLMAAGASSPELFSSFVALFITHSALGLGTIVGSEIFNQLIICAGAVWASKSGKLQLDPAILIREVGFYALSICLLYFALQDVRPEEDDPDGEDHIFISFADASMVFGGYVLYVIVCANMDSILGLLGCLPGSAPGSDATVEEKKSKPEGYGAMEDESSPYIHHKNLDMRTIPFLRDRSLGREPEGNFKEVEYFQTPLGEKSQHFQAQESFSSQQSYPSQRGSIASSIRRLTGRFLDDSSLRRFDFLLETSRPADFHELLAMELTETDGIMKCFLWQRSYFYNKAQFATHGWQLRFFTFGPLAISSVPNRTNAESHRIVYPSFNMMEVDDKRLIVKLKHGEKAKRDFYLQAPSKDIFDAVVRKVEKIIEAGQGGDDAIESIEDDSFVDNVCESLIEFPACGTNATITLFALLFPLRALMHYTVPDVRVLDIHGNLASSNKLGVRANAFLAIFSCLAWLVVGSYAMVASLENLADLMDIPAAVVGVTVSAAGTSLPNYVASRVAAEKGFGNMAVSNAFGSNTFNIMVGLGLPWFLYTSFGTGFQPYHGLKNEGILESVVILALVLIVFIVIIIMSRGTLYKWHAILFVWMYIAYLVYAIGSVYW